jgi:hypothetical protein
MSLDIDHTHGLGWCPETLSTPLSTCVANSMKSGWGRTTSCNSGTNNSRLSSRSLRAQGRQFVEGGQRSLVFTSLCWLCLSQEQDYCMALTSAQQIC